MIMTFGFIYTPRSSDRTSVNRDNKNPSANYGSLIKMRLQVHLFVFDEQITIGFNPVRQSCPRFCSLDMLNKKNSAIERISSIPRGFIHTSLANDVCPNVNKRDLRPSDPK